MYIAPTGIIRILRNVPLDKTYEHTIYHSSLANQITTMSSYQAYELTAQSYSRPEGTRGVLRVQLPADSIYNCNYVMFQNTGFGTKWFYAFINSVSYINNAVSEIAFEIDVMQTWFFDYQVEPSFIEREHSLTDNIGDNLVPENLEHGEYMNTSISRLIGMDGGLQGNGPVIVIGTTFVYDPQGEDHFPKYAGAMYNGIYSGVYLNAFYSASLANAFIEEANEAGKENGIVCMFMMYSDFFRSPDTSMLPLSTAKTYTMNVSRPTTSFWPNYTVRNKKLLTAPYVQLYVTDFQGTGVSMPFEYFSGNTFSFSAWGNCSPDPAIILAPNNYKGVIGFNLDEKFVLKGFPQCAYNTDAYKAWLAQNGSSLAVSSISSAMGAAASIAAGNVVGGTISGLTGIANTLATIHQHAILPKQAHGNVSGNALYSGWMIDLGYCVKYIRLEFAKIIDDYFNCYGYACHEVKRPNIGTRPHWNYVKTRDVCLSGSIPADDMAKISSIYNAGITFWKTASEVGNYLLDNSPV